VQPPVVLVAEFLPRVKRWKDGPPWPGQIGNTGRGELSGTNWRVSASTRELSPARQAHRSGTL